MTSIDWVRRVVAVEPTEAPGVARWSGSGQPLSAVVARGVREVLLGRDPGVASLSGRAGERLAALRAENPWAQSDATTLVTDGAGRARWWTFAGWKANLWLAQAVSDLRREVAALDDLGIALDPSTTTEELARVLAGADLDLANPSALAPWVIAEAVDGLKFSECLPPHLAVEVVTRRLHDPASVTAALGERVAGWH